uniref:Uncharacterized protein n=1 Tax=Kalanchoe fedtschenkoi TaxID=63787 RepID=A0A7N0UJD3_KALFE
MGSGATGYQFPQSLSLSNSSKVRDPSFSAYLDEADGRYVAELSRSRSGQRGRVSADGEIGVFSADKYFNEGVEAGQKPRERVKAVESGLRRSGLEGDDREAVFTPARSKINLGTPSVRSDSSWHSQSALLHGFPSQVPGRHSTGEKQGKKSFLSGVSCRCSCVTKKSLKVDDRHGASKEPITIRPGMNRADQLLQVGATPPRKPWMRNSKMHCPSPAPSQVEKTRGDPSPKLQNVASQGSPYSARSFDIPAVEKIIKSTSTERQLNLMKRDQRNPRSEDVYIPPAISVEYFTDAESDASSDLFEIDSLTGHRKKSFSSQIPDSSASGYATPTTCYAPSEASIDWSVVTASAADFSGLSDCEELKPAMSVAKTWKNRDTAPEIRRHNNENINRSSTVRVTANVDPQKTREYVNSHQRMPVSRFPAQANTSHPPTSSRSHSDTKCELSNFK